jgi:hypothetical protein
MFAQIEPCHMKSSRRSTSSATTHPELVVSAAVAHLVKLLLRKNLALPFDSKFDFRTADLGAIPDIAGWVRGGSSSLVLYAYWIVTGK